MGRGSGQSTAVLVSTIFIVKNKGMRSRPLGAPAHPWGRADTSKRRRAVLQGASRIHVRETPYAAGGRLPAAGFAGRVGLRPNTVRWYLDQLVEAGVVTQRTDSASSRGRPRVLYTAGPDIHRCGGSNAGYRLLADIPASYLATDPIPAASAADAARAWGHYLTEKPAPFTRRQSRCTPARSGRSRRPIPGSHAPPRRSRAHPDTRAEEVSTHG